MKKKTVLPKESVSGQRWPAQTFGLDEAGRGCLAGPVVAAAVMLQEGVAIPGLDDSKKLSERKRCQIEPLIRANALAFGIGLAWPDEIARRNILQASLIAMARALSSAMRITGQHAALLLVDGTFEIPAPYLSSCDVPKLRQCAVIDGDALVPAISAASVLAKNFRDRLMVRMDGRYPGYGFARHKGYGTADHREAIGRLGPCPLHRLDFSGVLPKPARGRLC